MGLIADFAAHTVFNVRPLPFIITSNFSGTAVDMTGGSGLCMATQMVGVVSGTLPTLDGKIQESVDGSSWTDVSGATFAQVTSTDVFETITFTRTKQYLRYLAIVGGTSPNMKVCCSFAQATAENEPGKRIGSGGGRIG